MESQADKLRQQIRMHEGVEHKVYEDTEGIKTVGVGRNLEDRGLSDDEIDYLLSNDIDICVKELEQTFDWYDDLDDIRKRVLIDMMFNLGMPRLKGFANMLKAIEAGAWKNAAVEMLDSKWAKSDSPNRAKELSDIIKSQ